MDLRFRSALANILCFDARQPCSDQLSLTSHWSVGKPFADFHCQSRRLEIDHRSAQSHSLGSFARRRHWVRECFLKDN